MCFVHLNFKCIICPNTSIDVQYRDRDVVCDIRYILSSERQATRVSLHIDR